MTPCSPSTLSPFDTCGLCNCKHSKAAHVIAGNAWVCVICSSNNESFFNGLVEKTTRVITMKKMTIFTFKSLRKALEIGTSDRSGIIFLTRVMKFLVSQGIISIVNENANYYKNKNIYKLVN